VNVPTAHSFDRVADHNNKQINVEIVWMGGGGKGVEGLSPAG